MEWGPWPGLTDYAARCQGSNYLTAAVIFLTLQATISPLPVTPYFFDLGGAVEYNETQSWRTPTSGSWGEPLSSPPHGCGWSGPRPTWRVTSLWGGSHSLPICPVGATSHFSCSWRVFLYVIKEVVKAGKENFESGTQGCPKSLQLLTEKGENLWVGEGRVAEVGWEWGGGCGEKQKERGRDPENESDLCNSESKSLDSGPSPQPKNLSVSISLFQPIPLPDAPLHLLLLQWLRYHLPSYLGPGVSLQRQLQSSPCSRNCTHKLLRTEPSSPETAHRLLLSLCGLGPAPRKGPCLETGTHTACPTAGSPYLRGEQTGRPSSPVTLTLG